MRALAWGPGATPSKPTCRMRRCTRFRFTSIADAIQIDGHPPATVKGRPGIFLVNVSYEFQGVGDFLNRGSTNWLVQGSVTHIAVEFLAGDVLIQSFAVWRQTPRQFFPSPPPFSSDRLSRTVSLERGLLVAFPTSAGKKFGWSLLHLPLPLADLRRMHLILPGQLIDGFQPLRGLKSQLGFKPRYLIRFPSRPPFKPWPNLTKRVVWIFWVHYNHIIHVLRGI